MDLTWDGHGHDWYETRMGPGPPGLGESSMTIAATLSRMSDHGAAHISITTTINNTSWMMIITYFH